MQTPNAYIKQPAMITMAVVSRPDTAMLTPDMAPSSSPISRAFVVPTAWLQVPMATPLAMRLFTRKIFDMSGAKMAPRIPVMMTAATVMDVDAA